jgi:hypothetical protein
VWGDWQVSTTFNKEHNIKPPTTESFKA